MILIKKIKLINYILVLYVIFSCERTNTKPPNILWITVEDISPNLGCYGDNKAHTPTLDSLASIGFKYINAIAFNSVDTELGKALLDTCGRELHLAGIVRENLWRNKSEVQFIIEDGAWA